ncbi:MAG TPA: XRE family transcriptional regulator [Mycobacterium sp.]|nr:XRE family transcriptional regulator [Mycobacterium sp.]
MGQSAPQDDSSIIVSLSEAAMHMYSAAIDALPFAEDKKFHKRADVVLEGMRKLRTALADAASTDRPSPAVIVELSNVRRRYDSLMEHAAAAPGSSLGQQLYVTRVHAKLSAEEVANGAGLPTHLPDELEAGATPSDDQAAKIRETIAALGGVPGTEHQLYHDPEPEYQEPEHHDHDEHHVNGHDEQFAEEHAG